MCVCACVCADYPCEKVVEKKVIFRDWSSIPVCLLWVLWGESNWTLRLTDGRTSVGWLADGISRLIVL